jgi:hypothetical protein
MNVILKKLYSNSNRLALMCDSIMICISIFQFNYNIIWFQVCILILSIFHILLIFFQDQHLNSTLFELQTQNNFANINIEKLNKENGIANLNIQTITCQLSNLLEQYNLAQSNIENETLKIEKMSKKIMNILKVLEE